MREMGWIWGSVCCRWKAHMISQYRSVHWSYFDISSDVLTNWICEWKNVIFVGVNFVVKLIGPGLVTSQNGLHPIKLEELTFQMSQERKLCNQRCDYSTSGWFAWHITMTSPIKDQRARTNCQHHHHPFYFRNIFISHVRRNKNSVMWVRQFSQDRDRGSIDEDEARQLKIRPRQGSQKTI